MSFQINDLIWISISIFVTVAYCPFCKQINKYIFLIEICFLNMVNGKQVIENEGFVLAISVVKLLLESA